MDGPTEHLCERAVPALAVLPVRLSFRFDAPEPLLAALRAGELDLVVATRSLAVPGVKLTPPFQEAFWAVGPPVRVLVVA